MLALRILCRLFYFVISVFTGVLKLVSSLAGVAATLISGIMIAMALISGLLFGWTYSVFIEAAVALVLYFIPALAQLLAEMISDVSEKLLDV
ncbi:MAG: hypothetical protein IK990_21085 [Ruminiclostridium sp.]|nr:hypothetical protein [Ruminiclostridium sp.]